MQRYEQIQAIGKCPQDSSSLFLVKDKQTQKYFMSKKIIVFEQSSSEQFILSQAKMLKQLSHPHILKHYDIFLEKDDLVQILEFCEYGDLFHYMQKKKQRKQVLSEKLIISWVMQILMALEYLHEKNIVHRLLTTQNIYLNHQGDLKIGSFGAAKHLQNTLQKANTIIGQPCNMSPQMVQGNSYDSKSDIWSLGCLIYQMATDETPFKYGNLVKLYDSIVKQPCPQLPVKYSKYLSPLYKKMMKKNPQSRPTASEILYDSVFVKLMKQYLKKKKIDSLDLNRINPKPLIIHKKLSNQRKSKQTLQPIVSARNSRIKTPNNLQVKQVEQKQEKVIKKSPRLSSKQKKQSQKLTPITKQNAKSPKISKKPQIPSPKREVVVQSAKQKQPVVSSSPELSKDQQITKLTTEDNKQIQYIQLLYRVKLQFLEQKYSPVMSKIFQKTEQFDSYKDLI